MAINVLIACRVGLFAEGLKRLLEEQGSGFTATVSGSEDLRDHLEDSPDIILADQSLCRQIFSEYHFDSAKVLCIIENKGVLSSYGDLSDMVAKGFAGFLPGYADVSMLRKAIESVHGGELWIDRKTLRDSFLHRGKDEINLTRREQEILRCLASGLSNKEIAQKLRITEQTVKSHCNHLYKKFGVKNRLQLALYTTQHEFDQFFT